MPGSCRLIIAAFVVLVATLASPPVAAHQFAPALLELQEVSAGLSRVSWKQPIVRVQGSRLRPVLPVECKGVGEPTVTREGTGARTGWEIECPGGLVDKSVGVEGIGTSRADVLLRVALLDGRSFQRVLTPDAPGFVVPAEAGRFGVLNSYSALGVKHILTGWDHLLFVLALMLLVGWERSLLWTITAFTAGHSVTLALATLGLVKVPQGPIEAAIALSIYFLAVELVQRLRGKLTITQRAPWAIAAGFGLLHGLGFAGALAEVGLPHSEIPLALFAFNVGIEIGQLGFVAVIGVLQSTARLLPSAASYWPGFVTAYATGSVAVYWFIERVSAMVFPA